VRHREAASCAPIVTIGERANHTTPMRTVINVALLILLGRAEIEHEVRLVVHHFGRRLVHDHAESASC
jgi:hypothetical protein